MAKASIYSYTNDPINKGDVIKTEDILELRKNVVKLLQDFHNHIGMTTNDNGTDGDNTKRQHAIATTSAAGFAPYSVYETLTEYQNKVAALEEQIKYSLYPELAIVSWSGDYNDKLPIGWEFCDGIATLYTDPVSGTAYKTPDLRYVEPVSVTSTRPFLSKQIAQDRTVTADTSVTSLGSSITKYYIIKKPIIATSVKTVELTIIQPVEVRIATNFSTSDPEVLKALPDGHSFTVKVPVGSDVVLDTLPGTSYIASKLKKKSNSSGTLETLTKNTFKITENTTITAEIQLKEFTFTIKGTSNQVITVICNGKTHVGNTGDVTFKVYAKENWTAILIANTGYNAGTLSKTSGTISDNVSISATNASLKVYTFTIKGTSHQTISVYLASRGQTISGSTSDITFSVNHFETWSAKIVSSVGYNPGTLSSSSGTITDNVTLSASTATLKSYTFTITGTTHQTITVVCAGKTYIGSSTTVTFTAYHFQTWTASIASILGYKVGTLNATSGTIVGNTTISATNATISPFVFTTSTTADVDAYSNENKNGCMLLGDEFVSDQARSFTIKVEYNISGNAWGASGCWSGSGFTFLPESKYTLSTGSKMSTNVWDIYQLGSNTSGNIPYDSDTLKTHPWGDFSGGKGASSKYGGCCVVTQCYNYAYGPYTSGSGSITLPQGKSYLAFIFNISCSKKDGAHFTSTTCSGQSYAVKVTLTPNY